MSVKVFTVEEANRILPVVEAGVRFIRERAVEIVQTQDRLSVLSLLGGKHPQSPENKEFLEQRTHLEELVAAYNARLEELDRVGCVIKDLNNGLVDFYCRSRDRLVFLCWRMGEKKIEFWHEIEGGFSGRRPIGEMEGQDV